MADINGTPDDDGLVGTPGDDTINGFAGNDVERARGGNDILNGDDGHDFLIGGDGNDTLNGGTGDDYLRAGEGDDVINGGDGFDRAAFTVAVNNSTIGETGVQTGATVDLNIVGVAQNTGHGMDTLTGIENVSGTTFNDTLIGDANNNWIWGEGGNEICRVEVATTSSKPTPAILRSMAVRATIRPGSSARTALPQAWPFRSLCRAQPRRSRPVQV